MKKLNKAGFTLVELLVAIGIISLALAFLFPNFMGARERARDMQRKSDLKQVQSALELYKQDRSPPAYPTGSISTSCGGGGFEGVESPMCCNQCWSSQADCAGNLYMRKFPCDPAGGNPTPYIYSRDSVDNLKYALTACLENPVDPDRDPTPEPTCGAGKASYTVHEP